MLCAMGILIALLERGVSGKGQVVDAAMVCRMQHGHGAVPCRHITRVVATPADRGCQLHLGLAAQLRLVGLSVRTVRLCAPFVIASHVCWCTSPAARGTNMLNSGAHFYEVYETKDGKFVSMCAPMCTRRRVLACSPSFGGCESSGAIEPQFYDALLRGLGLADDESLPPQMDSSGWPAMKERFASIFASKTRDEWCVP